MQKHLGKIGLFVLLLSSWAITTAQSPTGTIDGTVTDQSGAVMRGASVRVLNTETGVTRETKTDQSGLYSLPALPPGIYNVVVESAGFKNDARSNIVLQVQQTARVDFALTIGSADQTVNVLAATPLLSAEDSTIGQVIENKRIVELPLNGRNYLQLASLSPGVTNTSAPSNGASSFQGGARGSISITINGQRNGFNHFTLDGIENTDPNFNTYILLPSVDALQEFKIQTATYPSEFGFAVSQINVTTKSGTNGFHGSAFEFLRNSWFDSKNFFDSPTVKIPEFRRNQFGGTVGGPILKNRLFFLGNYEGLRDSKAQTIVTTVPTAALLGGNFTGQNIIYDPSTRVTVGGVTTATPFPGNTIPSSRFSPISAALLNYWSAPNQSGATNNYVNHEPLTNSSDQYMARIDYQMTKNLSWFGRYNYDKDAQYVPVGQPHQGSVIATRPDQILAGGTQILGPRLVNEARFGWSRFVNSLAGYNSFKTDVNGTILHIPGLNATNSPAFWGVPTITVAGYSGFGEPNTVYLTHNNIWEGHDTLSWTRGKHFLKFGGAFEPIHYNQTGNQFARGAFQNDGTATGNPQIAGSVGNPVADFLLGYVSFSQSGIQPAAAALQGSYYAVFVGDTWHMTPKLTVDYGLRYEYLTPLADQNDASSNLSGTNTASPTLVRASNMGTNLDPYAGLVVRLTNVPIVRDGSLGPGLVNGDKNNFAPRLGVSYSLDDKTVVRAGVGTFYDVLDMGNSIYDMSRTLAGSIQVSQNPATLNLTFANPFAGSSSGTGATISIATPTILANDPNIRSTYVNEWTLDIQRSVGKNTVFEVGYVGNQGHRLKRELGANIPQPGSTAAQSRRPWQNIGFVQQPASNANANYNGLQMKVQRSFSNGFSLLSAYTFSKSIDNTSGVRPGAGDNLFPNNPFSIGQGERGLSSYDARHRWVTSGLLESPVGKNRPYSFGPVGNVLLSDWQLGGIFTVQTGSPLTVSDGSDVPNIGNGATPRPNVTGQPIQLAHPTVAAWFNTAAFVKQTAFTFGNDSRNNVIGPGVVDLDMSLMKTIPFGERVATQLRWEVFNVANHPIFALPNGTLNSTAFGTISATKVDNREMQVAARIVF
jgi:hypothetical protein